MFVAFGEVLFARDADAVLVHVPQIENRLPPHMKISTRLGHTSNIVYELSGRVRQS